MTTTSCNWTIPTVTPVFEIFIAVLGIAAAIWGGWLEHAGPRKAGLIAALCWGGGLAAVGFGVSIHQLWVIYLAAILAGIGQGLGYITPVSTLIKWFPDRRGLATGFAIMGYGRRRNDRRAAGGLADGASRPAQAARRRLYDDDHGRHLFRRDEPRRARLPRAADRLVSARL